MANTSHLRKLNEQRIVNAMLRLGRSTRSDLAHETGMSQPTIGRIVEGLLKEQTLSESDDDSAIAPPRPVKTSIGRPSRHLTLNNSKPRFLALQLGVRTTRIALLPTAPPTKDEWDLEFSTARTMAKWQKKLTQAVSKLNLRGLAGVVVSVPGVVDEVSRRALFSPNLRWIEDIDFSSISPKLDALPLFLSHEIRLLALGHSVIHPKIRNFLLVDVGSGVGAAVVNDGAIMSSALPLSGELGHSPVIGNERICSCGSTGCVETLVSRPGLLATAAEHHWPSTWPELIKKLHAAGIPPWLRESLDALATTIAAAMNIIGLDHVVITGAIRELPPDAADYLQLKVEHGTMWRRFGPVQCRTDVRHRLAGMTAFGITRILLAE